MSVNPKNEKQMVRCAGTTAEGDRCKNKIARRKIRRGRSGWVQRDDDWLCSLHGRSLRSRRRAATKRRRQGVNLSAREKFIRASGAQSEEEAFRLWTYTSPFSPVARAFIRARRIYVEAGYACWRCREPAQTAHHVTYPPIGAEELPLLAPACYSCNNWDYRVREGVNAELVKGGDGWILTTRRLYFVCLGQRRRVAQAMGQEAFKRAWGSRPMLSMLPSDWELSEDDIRFMRLGARIAEAGLREAGLVDR